MMRFRSCIIAASAIALTASNVGAQANAIPQTPAEKAAYVQLTAAYAMLRRNELDSAITRFVAALALTPNRLDVRKELAYTYFHVGRNDLARDQFDEVLSRDSLDTTAAMELAYLEYESVAPADRARTHALFNRLRTSRDTALAGRAAAAFHNIDAGLAATIASAQAGLKADSLNGLLLVQLATAAQERNDFALANRTYQTLASHFAEPEQLAYTRFLLSTGRKNEATVWLKILVQAPDPHVAEAARDLLAQQARPKP